jgi:hypothetical protein
MLHITQTGSFKMDRKMKDGSIKTQCRRYAYSATGDASALDLFKRDILAGTNKGAKILDNGDVIYYSWRKCLGGQGTLLRSKLGNWFIDTESIDDLESLAEQSPSLMKALGSELLDRMLGAKQPEAPKQQEQDSDDDEDAPF